MRVVELDRGLVGQRADIAERLDVTADQVLQRCGDEEIFLPQPQFLPGGRGVATDTAPWRSTSARTWSVSAPAWSPRLNASSRSGSAARADHSRSVLTRRPRQPTAGVS